MSDTTASSAYATAYRQSITDPDSFWLGVAREEIQWTTPPTRAVDGSEAPFYHWFPDGQLNTCYNAVDRHVAAGRGDQAAYIWDSAVTGVKETITYAQLQEQVAAFAGALAAEGVGKGDRVVIYMPMVPRAAIAMLACARLGLTHSVVFAGFSSAALRSRVDDASAKVVITADGQFRRGKPAPLKAGVDEALGDSLPSVDGPADSVQKVLVVRRTGIDVD